MVTPAHAQSFGGGDGGGQPLTQEQRDFCEKNNVSPCTLENISAKQQELFCEENNVSPCTLENISAKQVELFCEQYNVSPCTRENALAKAQELGLAPQAEGMRMTTSGGSVDVVLDVTYGNLDKDLLSGSPRQQVDYTVTFYKPGTSELMPHVYYALVDYSNEPKAECPSTNDLCRDRIPGMFFPYGGSNIGITVTDHGQTIDTMGSTYDDRRVDITQSGGQLHHDASEFEVGSNTIEVIVGAIDGKQIPQESAKFNINVAMPQEQIDFCAKNNVSPCTAENISAKQQELSLTQEDKDFCAKNDLSPCDGPHILAKQFQLEACAVHNVSPCTAENLAAKQGLSNQGELTQEQKDFCAKNNVSPCTTETIAEKLTGIDVQGNSNPTTAPNNGGKCLIATAAFGSELTPQVQFLRNFRDNHILSTTAGSSFMNVFNAWYYSFSPSVADYERQQPWLQQTVKTGIYPLLGILGISEQAYSLMPGNVGSLFAGFVASSLIGAVYLSPATLAFRKVRNFRLDTKLPILLGLISLVLGLSIVLSTDTTILMISSAGFVVINLTLGVVLTGLLISKAITKIQSKAKQ